MFAKSGLHASLIADFTLCASEIGGDKKEVPILVSFFFLLTLPIQKARTNIS